MKKANNYGQRLIAAMREAVEIDRGETSPVRARRVALTAREAAVPPAPPFDSNRIAKLRGRLKLSQPVFAQALNVSRDTVKAWEQGKRAPEGAALRLLELVDERPDAVLSRVRGNPPASRRVRGSARGGFVR